MTDQYPAEALTVSVDPDSAPGAAVLRAAGELDVYTAPRVQEAIASLPLDTLDVLVADLAGLTFIDSSGLGVLIAAQKQLRTHSGDLRVVCTQGPVLRLLEVTGLLAAIPVHATVDEALSAER